MSTQYQIIVENNSPSAQQFFFFQEPAVYSGGSTVYSNSIGSGSLPAYASGTVNQLQFTLLEQYYAGVQTQSATPAVGVAQTNVISQVAIELASSGASTTDSTTVVLQSDGSPYLTTPVADGDVQDGAFRIVTPTYTPSQYGYNIGLSTTTNVNDIQEAVLSNYISAEPTTNTDVQPIVKFYVNTGAYVAGTTVNFTSTSSTAALCDATSGKLVFSVVYNADGTWTVS